MQEFVGVVTNQNGSCCPELDLKTRIIGFVITFIIGLAITIMSMFSLPSALLGSPTFAILYTCGNITSICS